MSWIGFGTTLCAIFAAIENSESRLNFLCDAKGDIDKDFIRGKCFDQYQKQYNKLGIPVYSFVIVNFFVITIVSVIYSQCVKSTVHGLEEHSDRDAEAGEHRNRCDGSRLFVAYSCQLAARFALGILFIVAQTQLLYPSNFPSDFRCHLGTDAANSAHGLTNSTQATECNNQRATNKRFWNNATTVVNVIFALVVFIELVWILSRASKSREFMNNRQFFAVYLQSRQHQELIGVQFVKKAIKTMKTNCLNKTDQIYDLRQPFRPKPGEGLKPYKDLKVDEIYVNVVMNQGRDYLTFPEGRNEQLRVYPPTEAKHSHYVRPQDIIDEHHKNILVVGRPGIGKTLFSTKLLRLWASDEAFTGKQNDKMQFVLTSVLKFRRFNRDTELSLRELLTRAEPVQSLGDELWDFIAKNPCKVLLIFDGLDEFSSKKDLPVAAKEDCEGVNENDLEKRMLLSVLFNKLASGKLLPGASLVTTTRPTAVSCVRHLDFDRVLEILGFTSQKVEDYVAKFTEGVRGAKDKIWQHIRSNMNLFSLCYIPINCFIICHCLLQIITESFTDKAQTLPTKITDIYSMTVKSIFFNHNRQSPPKTDQGTYMDTKFDELQLEHKEMFKRLGEIAFKGIEEGRLLFGSSEVSGLEDCGLLHRLPDVKSGPLRHAEAQYCFTHLTIQEFLAGKHLTESMNKEEIRGFVSEHIENGTWEVVLQFVAGLLEPDPDPKAQGSNSDIFTELLPMSTEQREESELMHDFGLASQDSEPHTLTCWPAKKDKQTALNLCKCLYEIVGEKQQAVVQNRIEEIGFNAVDFSRCSLAPLDCAAVAHFIKNAPGVLCKNLNENDIGALGSEEVQKLLVNSDCKLNSLNLSVNNITDNGAECLAEALKHNNCQLNSLNLSFNNITEKGAECLAQALKHNNCQLNSLHLGSNNITNIGAKRLAEALKHNNCKLKSLDISINNITDYEAVAEALKHINCKLNTLDLSVNNITGNGAERLAEALKDNNCQLNSLNLMRNNITDEGAECLAEALKDNNCQLNSLNLSGNNITVNGAERLAEALKDNNCKLNWLNLMANNITGIEAQRSAKALKHSNCQVFFSR